MALTPSLPTEGEKDQIFFCPVSAKNFNQIFERILKFLQSSIRCQSCLLSRHLLTFFTQKMAKNILSTGQSF